MQDTPSKLQLPLWVSDFSARNCPGGIPVYELGASRFYHVATDEMLAVQAVKVATITSLFAPLEPSYTDSEVVHL
jgi:hypothetical protein